MMDLMMKLRMSQKIQKKFKISKINLEATVLIKENHWDKMKL
jgi:hypothetical protein